MAGRACLSGISERVRPTGELTAALRSIAPPAPLQIKITSQLMGINTDLTVWEFERVEERQSDQSELNHSLHESLHSVELLQTTSYLRWDFIREGDPLARSTEDES
ncbi:hypothetical protein EYF80_013975 [Liparis tanakae]|uniref:Uncharacterized protein n=1 Tax=Liparis tanakae TaxID=230148 RepID=A0A4Z2ICX3_9TELE|nr:hypothetical protein EYF80_013975 [Liparis tanakae]